MSVVAVSLPEFQPCIRLLVAGTASRKMAAITDGNGLSPAAVSSVAFNTRNAAATGTKLVRMTLTNCWNAVEIVEIQLAEMVPGLEGMLMPNAPIQWRICGRVRRMIVHTIHFPVLPLTWKFIPPSERRLSPAATNVNVAAGMASA